MDEIKNKLKALDPQIKFFVWAGLALVCWVLFCFLDVLPGGNGFKVLTEAKHLPFGSIFLIVVSLCMIIIPLLSIVFTVMRKHISAPLAYVNAALALFILLLFDFKNVAGIFWVTFIFSLVWACVGYILNGDEADVQHEVKK